MAAFFDRLKNLTRLERRRVDVALTRIYKRPMLRFLFNAFLLTINAFVRLRILVGRVLQSMGVALGDERRFDTQRLMIPSSMMPRPLPDPPRVLLIVEDSIEQCFRYRVQQKLEQLARLQITAEWISWRENTLAREKLHFNDIVIFYRVPGFPDVLNTIQYARAINKVVIYDVDDLIFDRKRLVDKFKRQSGQLSAHERNAMHKGAALYQSALQGCEFAITTTIPLKCEIDKLLGEGKAFVLANGLDGLAESVASSPQAPKDEDYIDLFYGSGTKTHDEDFKLVSGVLERLLSEFDRLRLIIVGYLTLPESFGTYGDRVIKLPIMPFESYLSVLSQADISIAPLEPGVFADCKSEIKWLEAGRFSLPSVVSATSTYKKAINNGIDGFTAEDADDWYRCLHELIVDEVLRIEIGQRACRLVTEKYGLPEMSQNLSDIIQSVIEQSVESGTVTDAPREKRRILYVNTVYPPNAIGGATVVMKNTIDEIRKSFNGDFEVLVFTCDVDNPIPYQLYEYEWEGVLVTALSIPTHPDVEWKYEDQIVYQLFRKFLEYQKPDLVHFHSVQRLTGSVLQAAYEAAIPFLITVHDAWWLSDYQFLLDEEGRVVDAQQLNPIIAARTSKDIVGSIARTSYLSKQLVRAEQLLAVSDYQADLYRKNGFSRILVNKNGVNPFADTNVEGVETRKLRLGYAGGLVVHKGYYFLKHAVEESMLENLEIQIIDFDLASGEQRHERWGGTDVKFVSKLPAERMSAFYEDMDILVAPSLWPESFGLVTREATLMGRWVVASDAGALAEDLQPGVNSHVFSVGDHTALKAILTDLNENYSQYRQRIPLSGQAKGKILSVSEQVRELVELYDSFSPNHLRKKNNTDQTLARQVV